MTNNKWSSLLHKIPATEHSKETYIYLAGDNAIFVEYGYDMSVVDYMDMFRVQSVYQTIVYWQAAGYLSLKGYLSAIPQWRSIQYNFNPREISIEKMVEIAIAVEEHVGDNRNIANMQFNSPIIELPFAWQHRGCRISIEKYLKELNPDAYWCDKETMSNIPFLCETNGVTEEELKRKVFASEYFAYTSCFLAGLTMSVPLDRRSMIIAEKYNPPRTWTYRNVRGLGGFDEGGYPVAAPGGYQLLGVAAPFTQMEQKHPDFSMDMALVHQLDRIRFVEVSEQEVDRIIDLVDSGSSDFRYKITPSTLSVADWLKQEEAHKDEIEAHLKHIAAASDNYYNKKAKSV